jgi:peptidoglycan/xylan/chitin deacetylase (PgdA/CDA1 family)
MIREATALVLRKSLQNVGRIPFTRKLLHSVSMATRGAGVVFLRLRRLLPDDDTGRRHPDRATGSLLPHEFGHRLEEAKRVARFVHIGEAIERLRAGRRLREPLAVLTFDESFVLTAELALPVCRQLGVPMLQFITTHALEQPHRTLWDEEVRAVLHAVAPHPLTVGFVDRPLQTDDDAAIATSHRLLLLSLASLDERELQRRLTELFAHSGGAPAVRHIDRMIDVDALQRLQHEPLFACGAHGHNHYAMAATTDDALAHELWRPRELLQSHAGSSFANVLSYPFGRRPYVDDRVIHAARAADYRAGFTAYAGLARPGDHLYQLPRVSLSSAGMRTMQMQGMLDAADAMVQAASGDQARLTDVQG